MLKCFWVILVLVCTNVAQGEGSNVMPLKRNFWDKDNDEDDIDTHESANSAPVDGFPKMMSISHKLRRIVK